MNCDSASAAHKAARSATAHPVVVPGNLHWVNPQAIPADRDEVLLSFAGRALRGTGLIVGVFTLLFGITLLSDALTGISRDTAHTLVEIASHPVLALLVGMLATVLMQSSSVTTSLTVAAVATGIVPVDGAVYLIIGANLGTCLTAMLVAFSNATDDDAFRRSFASSMTHTLFNFFSALFLFPIEYLFHPLEKISGTLAEDFLQLTPPEFTATNLAAWLMMPLTKFIGIHGQLGYYLPHVIAAAFQFMVAILIVIGSVRLMTGMLRSLTAATAKSAFSKLRGQRLIPGVLTGLGVTALIGSSTTVTSSMVAFAGSDTVGTRESLNINLGANLGTTLTAFLVALTVQGPWGPFALQAALLHVMFNLIPMILVVCSRRLRRMLIEASDNCATLASGHGMQTFTTTIIAFWVIPAIGIAIGYILILL